MEVIVASVRNAMMGILDAFLCSRPHHNSIVKFSGTVHSKLPVEQYWLSR